MHKGDTQKWRSDFKKYQQWDTEKARKVQEKEARVILRWLKGLGSPEYNILEIGCGNGYVGKLIITELLKQEVSVTYTFADLVPECIEVAKKNTKDLQHQANIKFQLLDVFEADKTLGEKSQDIIISTGYASAATYKDAVPIVSKILKADGVLICDFVNHLSPILFISKFPRSFFLLSRILRKKESEKEYYFGTIGIKKYFYSHKLKRIAKKTIRFRRNPLLCMFRKI